ncbi:MAG: glycosyltransferase family 4 protein [Candidatus Solibacter usitatus]|nr:glycosyltransferase family 4 protein [Candidatus Solibacter usitatus]
MRAQNGVYTVQGQPLYFFHFSGFDPENPEPFSRHQNRVRLSGLGEAAPLVLDYGRDLMARGWAECKKWPYAYGSFRNGVRIVDMGRQMYREAPGLSGHIQDPFSDQGHQAFLEFWNEPLLDSTGQGAGLTRLAYKIYRGRTDVRAAMPDVWGLDRVAFLQWMAERSPVEHGIQDELIEPVRRALQAAKAAEALNRMKSRPSPPPEEPAAVNDGQAARARLPRLAQSIYELRPDLHKAFPDVLGRDRARFLRWLLVYGKEEFRLDEALLAPIREHWERTAAEAGSLPARLRMKAGLLVWSHVAETRKRVAAGMSRQRSNQALAEAKATDVPSAAAGAAPNPDGLRFGVNLVGHLRSELSVGETVRLAAEAARAAGLPVSLKNIGHDNPFRQQDFRAGPLSHVFPYCFNVFHVNADEFPKVAATQAEPLLKGKYNIGFWVWETEEFPDRWLNSFSHLHEVWAPSAFCQEAIARKSPVPVLRIPYAISVPAPEGVAREHLGLPGEGFLFLMIFDMLSCFERKNPLGLIEAFKRAFGGAPQYRLAIKISNGHHRPVFLERLHARAEGLPVTILDEVIPRDKMNAMIAACDCLVSLHRSEGFGLTLAEAMYLGKPVIATGYSGNLDFTLPSTSFLVDYRLCEVGKDCEPYDAGSVWAEPSLDHAAAQMRAVAGNPELRGRVAEAGQRFVRDRFSPLFVGRRMVERLNHLLRTRLVQA